MDRKTVAYYQLFPRLFCKLSHTTEPELRMDLWRNVDHRPGATNHHRDRACHALYPRLRDSLSIRRTHYARCELWLALTVHAFQWRLHVLFCYVYSYCPWSLLRLL